jgi:hypothetical protein
MFNFKETSLLGRKTKVDSPKYQDLRFNIASPRSNTKDKFLPYKGGGIFKRENPRKLDTGQMLYNLKHTMNLYG